MLEHSAYLSLPANIQTDGKIINLTLNLLTTTIVAPPNNASKWEMGFNSAFKGLMPMAITPKIYRHVLNMLHGIMFGHTDNFMWSSRREMSRPNRKTCFCAIQ
jgi:hypothetical protein